MSDVVEQTVKLPIYAYFSVNSDYFASAKKVFYLICKVNFLTDSYKDSMPCSVTAEEEKLPSEHLQHQHVLCSSAAAAGCWML